MEWEKEEACELYCELYCYVRVTDLFTERSTPCWVQGCKFEKLLRKREEKGASQARLLQWAKASPWHLSGRLREKQGTGSLSHRARKLC